MQDVFYNMYAYEYRNNLSICASLPTSAYRTVQFTIFKMVSYNFRILPTYIIKNIGFIQNIIKGGEKQNV